MKINKVGCVIERVVAFIAKLVNYRMVYIRWPKYTEFNTGFFWQRVCWVFFLDTFLLRSPSYGGQNKDVKPQDGDLSFKCGSTGPRLLEDLTGNHPWKHQSLLGACGLRRIYPYIYPNHIWNHMNTYGNLIIARMMINLEILISLWTVYPGVKLSKTDDPLI